MIHEEEEVEPIDFSWILFIGKAKLGLSFKETGRLTLKLFTKLYQHYKDNFDLEMYMKNANTGYAQLEARQSKEDEWF